MVVVGSGLFPVAALSGLAVFHVQGYGVVCQGSRARESWPTVVIAIEDGLSCK